ncbi:hypothetical protein BC835DRAFT_1289552, partial [Cytidiella melzeri]
TPEDYCLYVAKRDELICSFQGRAALLQGGSLWQLARDSFADWGQVYAGPSAYPTQGNLRILGGWEFVEDNLSQHQEDVICGVYRVQPATAKEGPFRSVSRSLWPSVTTWENFGMNLNYWSTANEWFYIRHRALILAGQVQPRSVAEWKKSLASRKVPKTTVLQNTRHLASLTLPAPRG